jgi:hypothetical protein
MSRGRVDGGSGYNVIEVSAPVRFHGQRDRVDGQFAWCWK